MIDLLRMQLTSAQEREARHHELISLSCLGDGGGRGGSVAAEGVQAEDGDDALPSARPRKTAGVKAAEAAFDSFFSMINPLSTADRAASKSPAVPASPVRPAGTTPAPAAGSRSSSAAGTAADDADSTSLAPAAEELAAAQHMLQKVREREREMAVALATQSAQLQRVRAEAAAMCQALVELREAMAQNTDELRHSLQDVQDVLLRHASARAHASAQLSASQSEGEATREALAQETQRRHAVEERLAESESERVVERQRERQRSEARARAAAVEAQLDARLGAAVEACVHDAEAALVCVARARSEAGVRGDALRQCLADALLVKPPEPLGFCPRLQARLQRALPRARRKVF